MLSSPGTTTSARVACGSCSVIGRLLDGREDPRAAVVRAATAAPRTGDDAVRRVAREERAARAAALEPLAPEADFFHDGARQRAAGVGARDLGAVLLEDGRAPVR